MTERSAPLGARGLWARHLCMYYSPAVALAFLATAPHPWWIALPCIFLGAPLEYFDGLRIPARKAPDGPPSRWTAWAFDAHLLLLSALHFLAFAWFARNAAVHGFRPGDVFAGLMIVGGAAANGAVVVAHELIHRRGRGARLLGRALLVSVFYEHFYTEHVRGHHVRVGTPEDPATARFGESFGAFLRRTIPGQFRSAWRLEAKRLGDENMRLSDPRLLRSVVVHGLAAQAALALALLVLWGPAALAAWLLAAAHAVVLLEIVNYLEHWGLSRAGRAVTPEDSWDTDSAGTVYALAGLARHADHHTYPTRPYYALRPSPESPRLPYGYLVAVNRVAFRNRRFRERMTEELRRRKLGPFRESAAGLETQPAA